MRGQDPRGLHHPVEVVGRRLPADENHALPRLAALLGRVGVEDDRARRGAGRGVQPLRDDGHLGARVDHRVEELVELRRVDPRDRLLLRDQPLLDHLDRRAQRRRRRSLRRARLEEVERRFLDGELDVLHVAVVLLEPRDRREELLVRLGQELTHPLDRLGRPDPGDDVLALRVLEELAVEPALAGRGVAREADARPGGVALVPEDHLDDVDGGADVVRDLVGAPVDLCARRVPRIEDGADCALELSSCILGEGAAGLLLVDALEGLDQLGEIGLGEVGVLLDAARRLQVGERLLEAVALDPLHDLAVHLDQPPVGVVGEARVAGRLREPCDGIVVEAEVEDRVHHPGHRDGGARADGHEQRIVGIPEALAGLALERGDVLRYLGVEPVGKRVVGRHVRAAGVGRDREARGDGDAQRGHLREPDPLAAEELPATGRLLVEGVDVAHAAGNLHSPRERPCSRHGRRRPVQPRFPDRGFPARSHRIEPAARLLPADGGRREPRVDRPLLRGVLGARLRAELRDAVRRARGAGRASGEPGRDLRRRRQHREHAGDLACPRDRPGTARGLGTRRRSRRHERGRELLVRGLRHRLVRAGAARARRRARPARGELLPSLRRRAGTAADLHPARARRSAGAGLRRRRRRGLPLRGNRAARGGHASGKARCGYRVTAEGEEPLEARLL